MNNICQITNYDLATAASTEKTIIIGGRSESPIQHTYKIITSEMLGSEDVFKFGYCTNSNQGMNYPIFLTINGVEEEIEIGKTGMYEFQPEVIGETEEGEEEIAIVSLSRVLVPADIPFCIDYCYSV